MSDISGYHGNSIETRLEREYMLEAFSSNCIQESQPTSYLIDIIND